LTTPELSIVVPSLRESRLQDCLRRLEHAIERLQRPTEIVVVSPFAPPSGPRIRHVSDAERRGICWATNAGYLASAGRLVMTVADDMLLERDSLRHLLAFHAAHDGETVIVSLRGYDATHIWTTWGYYGFPVAYCPLVTRRLVGELGGSFYDPLFHSNGGDHDLSLRVWRAGGSVLLCPDAWFESVSITDAVKADNNARIDEDMRKFFERWEPIYGALVGNARDRETHMAFCNQTCFQPDNAVPPEFSWLARAKLRDRNVIDVGDIAPLSSKATSHSADGLRWLRHILANGRGTPAAVEFCDRLIQRYRRST
jgi:glycosyltransferase involved in cell wall biosynthesis